MKTFKTLNELLEELYVELDANYPREHYIDELVNELYVFLAENHNDDTVSKCDGDCKNCKYAYEDDSDEYEHGYNDVPQDLEDFMNCKYDDVSHPSHYTSHGIETIDKIEAVIDGLPAKEAALLANVIKYVDRAGLKDDAKKDLDKANAYAHRLVYGHWRKRQ